MRVIKSNLDVNVIRQEIQKILTHKDLREVKRFYNCNWMHRLLIYGLPDSDFDYKIVKIHRKHEDVAWSLLRKSTDYRWRKTRSGIWRYFMDQRNRPYIIRSLNKRYWASLGDYQHYMWHCKESDKQWNRLKERLDPARYMEIKFNDFIGKKKGLQRISDFVEIPFDRNLVDVKANG